LSGFSGGPVPFLKSSGARPPVGDPAWLAWGWVFAGASTAQMDSQLMAKYVHDLSHH
jgi:hypothetical protein